jgi:hypothetical protein
LVLIIIGVVAYTRKANTLNIKEGGTVTVTCGPGQIIKIVSAYYTPPNGKSVDVTGPLGQILTGTSGTTSYTVSGQDYGLPSGGELSFRYRCVASSSKSGFAPLLADSAEVWPEESDKNSRGSDDLVTWEPYSRQSRVSLERGAETPENAEPYNPITGLGKTSAFRRWNDRYRGITALPAENCRRGELQKLAAYEIPPGKPGYMEEETSDGAMSLILQISRRPQIGASAMTLSNTDVDSDYLTDGIYDRPILREALTSTRQQQSNTLVASKTGLGSVRRDPRFEPGTQRAIYSGDTNQAHGGHAGNITLGSYTSSLFAPSSHWDWRYVHGFGVPEVI